MMATRASPSAGCMMYEGLTGWNPSQPPKSPHTPAHHGPPPLARCAVSGVARVGLVPQSPWLLGGASVRDNITLGRPFDPDLYARVRAGGSAPWDRCMNKGV